MEIEIMLNGEKQVVEAEIQSVEGPDPDVGIMGPWVDDYTLYKNNGEELTKEEYRSLSDDDLERIDKMLNETLDDWDWYGEEEYYKDYDGCGA